MKCRNEAYENSLNRKDNSKTLQQQICRFFQARKKESDLRINIRNEATNFTRKRVTV